MNRKLITFEGVDGVGKTTQARLLSEYFTRKGIDHILTCEPCFYRKDIFSDSLTDLSRFLLFMVDRQIHIKEVIRPALVEGKVVICDRFVDSTTAYQIYGLGIGEEILEILLKEEGSSYYMEPNLTFWLDGCYRGNDRDPFEKKGKDYYAAVAAGYAAIYKKEVRMVRIDANRSIEEVHKDCVEICRQRLEIS